MKKILALLSLCIVALFNNLEPVQVDEMSFTEESYYKGKTHTEVDYQSLYYDYIDDSSFESNGCNTTPVSAGSLADKPTSNGGRVWFIYEEEEKDFTKLYSDKAEELQFKNAKGKKIIAPSNCWIYSSANKSRNGTEMTIAIPSNKDPLYKITFYNMARWYCCRDRSPSITEDITATFTHTKDAKGNRLSQGDLLGYATKSTTVLVEELVDGEYIPISTKDFFEGTSHQ